MTCTDSNPISRGARQHPFYVDRSWNREEAVIARAPASMKAGESPPAFSTTCMLQADESFEQANIRAMFDKIVEADRTTVAFQQSEEDGAGR
jgi:hypothetical protein